MNNVTKDAAKDAAEFAAASMAYGEGAGTRRKLIQSAVEYKTMRIPGYGNAFSAASNSQDITKHIRSAKRSRTTKDIGAVTSRNVKALARGDKNGMSTPIIVAVVVAGVMHKTGYDKTVLAYTKRKSGDVRSWLKRKL